MDKRKVIILFAAYAWVGLMHSFLVGTFVYAWLAKKIIKGNGWLYYSLIFCILLFFESYWIPLFNYLEIKVSVAEPNIGSFFNINPEANIINNLKPGIVSVISCLLQSILATFIGRKLITMKTNQDAE